MPAARLSQDVVEVLSAVTTTDGRVSQDVVEVLYAFTAGAAPSGSFGAAASQDVIEVLMNVATDARVSQDAMEVLMTASGPFDTGSGGTGGGARPSSFGYAV